ncbi:24781_t:CDS:2, partial [Racocetra persica]
PKAILEVLYKNPPYTNLNVHNDNFESPPACLEKLDQRMKKHTFNYKYYSLNAKMQYLSAAGWNKTSSFNLSL